MKAYLSFGGGINSVAMMLLLLNEGIKFESVFSDTGCEMPETYAYLKMLRAKDFHITTLKPVVQNSKSLYEHCWKKHLIPSRARKWCSDKFKKRPLHKYFQGPGWTYIGMAIEEAHRAKIVATKNIEHRYPLIEREITRQGCIDIIKAHGLPVPVKSGCFFCPQQPVGAWRRLRCEHPDLFYKAKALEGRNIKDRIARGKKPIYLSHKPLELIIHEKPKKEHA